MTLQKLTSEDKSSIQYFWEEKGDLTRWTGWKEKLDIIKQVIQHGGFDINKIDENKLRNLLDVGEFNSEETYMKVPNILAIENKLGSNEYGFLFK